ncbi:MAG: winged helix-turn-helix transcriptional regulator [Methanobacteriota archaeon]
MAREKDDLEAYFAKRFEELEHFSGRFTAEMIHRIYGEKRDIAEEARVNSEVIRSVSTKWSVDIIFLLHALEALGFEEIKRFLPGISSRTLSQRLKDIEGQGYAARKILSTRPPRVKYSLTEKGYALARIAAPMFLFIRYKEGLLVRRP